jgi:hypothetical protein
LPLKSSGALKLLVRAQEKQSPKLSTPPRSMLQPYSIRACSAQRPCPSSTGARVTSMRATLAARIPRSRIAAQ